MFAGPFHLQDDPPEDRPAPAETGRRMLTCQGCGTELGRTVRSLEGVVIDSRCRRCSSSASR